jgi:hypothetical protein
MVIPVHDALKRLHNFILVNGRSDRIVDRRSNTNFDVEDQRLLARFLMIVDSNLSRDLQLFNKYCKFG